MSPAVLARALELPAPTVEQEAVICAPLGPTLVVAGAGAGKTETMAARVVWLVANGLVRPEQVLGLTFTRKAAQQLSARVRARLKVLAQSPVLTELDPTGQLRAQVRGGEPEVSTYHAYAGRLLAEHGLRLPVEPSARLLSETASWQLAHQVVSTWAEPLETTLTPATITERVRALASQLAEHLVDAAELRGAHAELQRLVDTLPPGERQRGGPGKGLTDRLAAQEQRLALLPLLARLQETMRRESALDFGAQMSLAARAAREHPEVGAAERTRFRAVLLDEYQDTGHAQRVLLRALFGGGVDPQLALTAVGDPIQSIYGWRGASAANLPRFATDFPLRADGTPAPRLELLTSWRNPPEALELANGISAGLRSRGVPVAELRARPGAGSGAVRLALTATVDDELAWVAGHVRRCYDAELERTAAQGRATPPTAAVLVRRRADAGPVADALRAQGLPVEVVGLGGLLDTPEVTDVVAVLRLLADPLAGSAAARVLTGARWQLGAADLVALHRRARELGVRHDTVAFQAGADDATLAAAVDDVLPPDAAEEAGLADAIADPGPERGYSAVGHARIRALGEELASLRERLGQPLPELVAEVERTLRVDVEVVARPGGAASGRAHLDAFADVVVGYATATSAPTLGGLLSYLAAAQEAEDGLAPGEVEVDPHRVQVLTVHAAKGLEWQVVAVPHLCDKVFPGSKRESSWLKNPAELPSHLRGDAADPHADPASGAGVGVPVLDVSCCTDRKQLNDALDAHEQAFDARRAEEERRLLYVALTRTEHTLLLSGHHWAAEGIKPKGPSEFLVELAGFVRAGAGTVEEWAPHPLEGETNPAQDKVRTAQWPVDPLGAHRPDVEAGAQRVRDALRVPHPPNVPTAVPTDDATDVPTEDVTDPDGWVADVDALLAERHRRRSGPRSVVLPAQLSVSQLVALRRDPAEFAARLRRPLPYPPSPLARRGTEFHAWVERRFGSTRLLDLDDLPGAADETASVHDDLAALQAAFLASEWAERRPVEVEVPFETELAGTVVRGRIDAVFAEGDGGFTVVDWKTGRVPDAADRPALLVQLAAYRLAWAELAGVDPGRVEAAFVYVRHHHVLRANNLLDADGLRALLTDATRAQPVRSGPGARLTVGGEPQRPHHEGHLQR
ncbi:MAG: ATP-dependent DNA helicase [Mycobacteriaceae bacterium]